LIAAKEKNLEQNLAELQSENKKLSEQLREVETKHQTNSGKTEVSDITLSGASSAFKNHQYAQGLSLFNQRQYSGAQKIFSILLENGVEGAIADNCEYWLGECCFAQREYSNAIGHFRKVLSLDSSNKKIDAYFMLGKTYERMGDGEKARVTYTELNARYPSNGHAKVVKSRLEALRNIVGD
jgi:TolA-binding protein